MRYYKYQCWIHQSPFWLRLLSILGLYPLFSGKGGHKQKDTYTKLFKIFRLWAIFVFVFCGTGVWTQGFIFARQPLYLLINVPAPFAFNSFFFFFFQIGCNFFPKGGLRLWSSYLSFSCAVITVMYHHAWLFSGFFEDYGLSEGKYFFTAKKERQSLMCSLCC
jgi:hypothetical protein